MQLKRLLIPAITLLVCLLSAFTILKLRPAQGAWMAKRGDTSHVLMITDDYLSLTAYANNGRRFLYTLGGPVAGGEGLLTIKCEYHSADSDKVGSTLEMPFTVNGTKGEAKRTTAAAMLVHPDIANLVWEQVDGGASPLAGNWHITQRMQDGKMQSIHQTGTRKTIKLLTGSRFQWVAIDPGAKGFYGTGGGTYTFEGGKYTENIGFFSRDSSRVGASLSFNGRLEAGNWHHSGKSSRGDDIHEVWSRGN